VLVGEEFGYWPDGVLRTRRSRDRRPLGLCSRALPQRCVERPVNRGGSLRRVHLDLLRPGLRVRLAGAGWRHRGGDARCGKVGPVDDAERDAGWR